MDIHTRQIIAFHVGDRSKKSAQQLWKNIPEMYRQRATFYTDQYESYEGVIPAAQHRAVAKESGKVNHLERLMVRSGTGYHVWLGKRYLFQRS